MKQFKGIHKHFDVPIFRVSRIEEIVPDVDPAIYELPIGESMVLTVLARIVAKPNQSLTVVSHGAKEPSVGLPYFNRFASLLRTDRSFLLLSDPTLELDHSMTLAWYLGVGNEDPLDTIAQLVEHFAKQRNIKRILFEGSSGGGFSSLRLAARFPSSVALVFSPQTNAFNYEGGGVADKVKDHFFGGGGRSDVLTKVPDRFSVVGLYSRLSREARRPFVYYVQNSGDLAHVRLQMTPFLETIEEGSSEDHGRLPADVHVSMVDQGPGHIRPTLEIWEREEAVALRILEGRCPPDAVGREADGTVDAFRLNRADVGKRDLRFSDLAGMVEFISDAGRTVSAYLRGENLAPSLLRVFLHPACASNALKQTVVDGAPEPPAQTLDLHVFDDMILAPSELRVAWFVGQREREIVSNIADLVENIKRVTFATRTLLVGASSGGFAALRLKSILTDAHVLAFAPDVSIRVYSKGHRDRFMAAAGFTERDWDDISVARRLDITLALTTSPLGYGPRPKVLLNKDAVDYEREQSYYLKAQTFQDSPVKAWAALGVDAEYVDYSSNIQRPAQPIYLRAVEEASERARAG